MRSLARRHSSNQGLILILLVGSGLAVLFLLARSKTSAVATYKNAETWDIQWNKDGLPTRVTIHRDAVQGGQ